jgi:hypothetical protein
MPDRVENESPPNPERSMRLAPQHPPCRATRKARAFEAEIGRLRRDGYTCEAIRQALAASGVNVSKSTVQREAARQSKPKALREIANAAPSPSFNRLPPPSPAPAQPSGSFAEDRRSGKDIAEAYVRNRHHNPLIRQEQR